MATFLRMQQNDKIEALDAVGADHTGNVGVFEWSSEDGSIVFTHFLAEDAVTTSEWNDAATGTHLTSAAAPQTINIKTGATTWVAVTGS